MCARYIDATCSSFYGYPCENTPLASPCGPPRNSVLTSRKASLRASLRFSDKRTLRAFRAQDIGMVLTGIAAQARGDSKRWSRAADELFSQIVGGYCWSSGFFADAISGPRRRFASFASQVYLTLACYAYGELKGDARAIEIANRCCRKLISLQGPNGEWPWFFDAKNGLVVDFYEIYSVHQYRHGTRFSRNCRTSWCVGGSERPDQGIQLGAGRQSTRQTHAGACVAFVDPIPSQKRRAPHRQMENVPRDSKFGLAKGFRPSRPNQIGASP